jgi:hypothetical protein
MSVYTTVFSASVPVGGIAAGALASTLGVPATLALSGGLSLLAGIGTVVWWSRIRSAGEQSVPQLEDAPSSSSVPVAPVEGGLGGRPAVR